MDNQRKKEKKRSPTIIKKIPKEIKNRISQNSIYIYFYINLSFSFSERQVIFTTFVTNVNIDMHVLENVPRRAITNLKDFQFIESVSIKYKSRNIVSICPPTRDNCFTPGITYWRNLK